MAITPQLRMADSDFVPQIISDEGRQWLRTWRPGFRKRLVRSEWCELDRLGATSLPERQFIPSLQFFPTTWASLRRGHFLQVAIGFIEVSNISEILQEWLTARVRITTVRNAMRSLQSSE
jgi:hypothetical protein